jgi:hypothetical protein
VQDTLEEKPSANECESGNVEVQCNNIKKRVLDNASDLSGKVKTSTRKPSIKHEMTNKMDQQREWKKINNEDGRTTYKEK